MPPSPAAPGPSSDELPLDAFFASSPPPPAAPAIIPQMGDDPFSALEAPSALPSVPVGASPEEARQSLFDMPAGGPKSPEAPVSAPPPAVPSPSAPTLPPPELSDFASIPVPKFDPSASGTGKGRGALGVALNLVIALLVVMLAVVTSATIKEGKLDLQSIKSLVTPASDFTASDISNGLYETKMGRPVFYVRGLAKNRSSSASRVRVRAELLDGETLLRSAEVVAGVPPSPEELHVLAAADEVKGLIERGAAKAPPIEAGASSPFLVPFAEYPTDLKAFRVRVSATRDGEATAVAQ